MAVVIVGVSGTIDWLDRVNIPVDSCLPGLSRTTRYISHEIIVTDGAFAIPARVERSSDRLNLKWCSAEPGYSEVGHACKSCWTARPPPHPFSLLTLKPNLNPELTTPETIETSKQYL